MAEELKTAGEKEVSQPLQATTTEQQDLTKAGQRNINLMWETTQAKIALICIIGSTIINFIVILAMLVMLNDITPAKVAVISAGLGSTNLTVGVILGFYFGRTNHDKTGGVGHKTITPEGGNTRGG